MFKLKKSISRLHLGRGLLFDSETEYIDKDLKKVTKSMKDKYFLKIEENNPDSNQTEYTDNTEPEEANLIVDMGEEE